MKWLLRILDLTIEAFHPAALSRERREEMAQRPAETIAETR